MYRNHYRLIGDTTYEMYKAGTAVVLNYLPPYGYVLYGYG